jgi:hypothetical protein
MKNRNTNTSQVRNTLCHAMSVCRVCAKELGDGPYAYRVEDSVRARHLQYLHEQGEEWFDYVDVEPTAHLECLIEELREGKVKAAAVVTQPYRSATRVIRGGESKIGVCYAGALLSVTLSDDWSATLVQSVYHRTHPVMDLNKASAREMQSVWKEVCRIAKIDR